MLTLHVLFSLFSAAATALYVASGSPCSDDCNSRNGTNWPDLVCADSDYFTTTNGQLLQTCLECEGKSLFINTTTNASDQYWYLFHMKYIQQVCLADATHAYTNAIDACGTKCAPLKSVLDIVWINSKPFHPQYAYCADEASSYPTYAPDCAACLRAHDGMVILGNMVETMTNACNNTPFAANQALIIPDRDLFATSTIPLPTSSSSLTSIATPTSSQSSHATSLSTGAVGSGNTSNSSLSTGAAAGIGISCSLAAVAVIGVAILIVRRRKRRSQNYQFPSNDQFNSPYYELDYKSKHETKPKESELYGHEVYETQGKSVKAQGTDASAAELPG